jgi:hypothetical protein
MSNTNNPSSAQTAPAPKPHRFLPGHPYWRRFIIGVLWIGTAILLVYAEEGWRGRRIWNNYIRELEARGITFDLRGFIPAPVVAQENFASIPLVQSWFEQSGTNWTPEFTAAELHLPPIQNARGPIQVRERIALLTWAAALKRTITNDPANPPDASKLFNLDTNNPSAQARADAGRTVLQLLGETSKRLDVLKAASSRPACRYPIVYDLENPFAIMLPHLAQVRKACICAKLRCAAELAAGETDLAFQDVRLIFYLGDTLDHEPFLVSWLVRLVCIRMAQDAVWEGLAQHRWTPQQLEFLQAKVSELDPKATLKLPIGTERAAAVVTMEKMRQRKLPPAFFNEEPFKNNGFVTLWSFLPSGWVYLEEVNYCRLWDDQFGDLHDLDDVPAAKQKEVLLDKYLGEHPVRMFLHHRVLSALLFPGLNQMRQNAVAAEASGRQAAIACALERYYLSHDKKYPEALDTLSPAFLASVPHDPINQQPFHYRLRSDGNFLLYSVGWDEKDDGGTPVMKAQIPSTLMMDHKRPPVPSGDWVWEYPTVP